MKAKRYIHKAPFRVIRINRRSSQFRLKRTMIRLRLALLQEKTETKVMLATYGKHTRGKASKAELAIAHQQFFDVLRGIGLGVFAVLPFAPITIPIIIKLGRVVGVEVIPSSFVSHKSSDKKNNIQTTSEPISEPTSIIAPVTSNKTDGKSES